MQFREPETFVNEPAGQFGQTADNPTFDEAVPALQFVHEEIKAPEEKLNVPPGHKEHDVEPEVRSLNFPAPQG